MRVALARFWNDETGATAIEYALLGTLIAVAIVGSFVVLGDGVSGLFNNGAGDVIGNAANRL